MIRRQLGIPLILIVTALGCARPKIDTRNDESMQASIKRVRETLPESDRERFDKALQTIMFSQVDLAKMMTGEKPNSADTVVRDMKTALQGKTGREVLALAEKIEDAEEQSRRQAALKEITELLHERDAALKARAELVKFEIQRARYSKDTNYLGMTQPQIMLRVRNGTPFAVSHAYFRGRLTSPGRSVPWLEDEFNYGISGGIEPGEEATWNLAPNMFSEWGTVKAPPDAGLEVTVLRLDGANGEPLFSAREFTTEDEKRLLALQTEIGAPASK